MPEEGETPFDFTDLPMRWNGSQQAFELTPEARERTQKMLDELQKLAGLTDSLRRPSATAPMWKNTRLSTAFRRI